MFDKDITIYCYWRDSAGKEKYIRKQIKGVFIDDTKIVNTNTNGLEEANSLFLAIPKETALNNGYLTPKEFSDLQDPNNKFTLKEGDKIVKGLIDTDYETDVDIVKNNEYVYTITGIDFKDFGSMPHFEISGK